MPNYTFHKSERLCSLIAIDRLFNGGSRSISAFPIRVVYRLEKKTADEPSEVKVLITVSKRHFHHAVDRNRVKRQIREAYRMRKVILQQAAEPLRMSLHVAFIWLDNKHWESNDINERMERLLNRIAEKISRDQAIENV